MSRADSTKKWVAQQLAFFFGMVDGPRKNSHAAAMTSARITWRLLKVAGHKPPDDVLRMRGLQAANEMKIWAEQVWRQKGKPDFPQTRADAECMAIRYGLEELIRPDTE